MKLSREKPKTGFKKGGSMDFLPFSKGKIKGFCLLLIMNEHRKWVINVMISS